MQSPSSSNNPHLPKRQQWAIINNYKAMQYERLKQLQKMTDLERKRHFKQELDNQLMKKNGVHDLEKEQDRRYYEYITKKTEEMKEKEQREKRDKIIKRKMVEEQNLQHLEYLKNSRHNIGDSGYNLEIGVKSEKQRKDKGQMYKRDMLDTLDRQLQMKEQERRWKKSNDLEMDEANLKYQYEQFDKRNAKINYKGQNPLVYDYYQKLDAHKRAKEYELQHVIVEEAAAKKKMQEDKKLFEKEQKKYFLTNQMKQTLDQQIQMHKIKADQEKRSNPQENSYSVIGNVFKQRQSPYNKRQYSEYLKRQAQQQNQRKKMEKYMSEEQYRINMNQLNRAVSGQYATNKYLDRSVGAIGDTSFLRKGRNNTTLDEYEMGKVEDQDAETVRMRLENLKHRENRSSKEVSPRNY